MFISNFIPAVSYFHRRNHSQEPSLINISINTENLFHLLNYCVVIISIEFFQEFSTSFMVFHFYFLLLCKRTVDDVTWVGYLFSKNFKRSCWLLCFSVFKFNFITEEIDFLNQVLNQPLRSPKADWLTEYSVLFLWRKIGSLKVQNWRLEKVFLTLERSETSCPMSSFSVSTDSLVLVNVNRTWTF